MDNPIKQAVEALESILCDPEGKPSVVAASEEDNQIINQSLTALRSIVNTGVCFKGYPVLLGPRNLNGYKPDKIVLTHLDRFLREHFPALDFLVPDGQPFVDGATPPKPKTLEEI